MTALLRELGRMILRLRYRVRLDGLDAVAAKGRRGILFLPNHPALIDPPIVVLHLHRRFAPRPLADRDQIGDAVLRRLVAPFRPVPLPDAARYGDAVRREVEQAVQEIAALLRRGENVVLYPAGHIARSRGEELGGNSAVETILRSCPDARIVLVRTRGLWGSSFSRASGRTPATGRAALRGLLCLLANGLFFAPRREVGIELVEPDDFPRTGDRHAINRYLEQFYNRDAPPNTYVPYMRWERGGVRALPEPTRVSREADLDAVPAATREIVLRQLRNMTGAGAIRDDQMLARDLGLDSLATVTLAGWIESEFGYPVGDAAANLATVGDVMLAACGTVLSAGPEELKPVGAAWTRPLPRQPLSIPAGGTLTDVFLAQARRAPRQALLADQSSGVKTYRDVVASVLALKPRIEALPGDYVGIMLPASAAAPIVYLAAVFAGKIPVMVNWTVGARNMVASLDLLGVQRVVTAGRLVRRVESQGVDLGGLRSRFALLEELGRDIPGSAKLLAWLQSRCGWHSLKKAVVRDTAVVLFTSGSESLPKAVPLTHANFLANMRDVTAILRFTRQDRMIGMLPPFHSFGILGTILFPLCAAIPAVYHPNPTEGGMLARLVEAYGVTVLIGTPTFLGGIVRAASDTQLQTLRAVVSGAEKCPIQLYDVIARRWPHMKVIEGYGITECSPVVSANREETIRPGTIGKVLPSVEYAIQDVKTGGRAEAGRPGMLLVRGPSIFGGYLNHDGPSPFVEFDGRTWYRTGDLVSEDAEGVVTFVGRLKRFVKLGGEMISLPAVEEVLAQRYAGEGDDKPVLAVEATPQELNPELVLFTVRDLDREDVNRCIRDGGLSPLHNIRRIVKLSELPVLGTGKTNYRALRDMLGANALKSP